MISSHRLLKNQFNKLFLISKITLNNIIDFKSLIKKNEGSCGICVRFTSEGCTKSGVKINEIKG